MLKFKNGALILGLALIGCGGPRPQLNSVRIIKADPNSMIQRLDIEIENTSSGEGQVSVLVRLIQGGSGLVLRSQSQSKPRVYQQQARTQLKPYEILHLLFEVSAPPGIYQPKVEVQYPAE